MPHILNTDEAASDDIVDMEDPTSVSSVPLSWETVSRCLMILTVVIMMTLLSWRPAMLRFSQLLFLVSPSHGDSLAWKPEPDPPSKPAPRKHTLAPAEWRLASNNFSTWKPVKEAPANIGIPVGDSLLNKDWLRFSFNPWSWRDDVEFFKKRLPSDITEPDQQPATAFRTSDGKRRDQTTTSDQKGISPTDLISGLPSQEKLSSPVMPSLAPEPLVIPELKPAGQRTAARTEVETTRPEPITETDDNNINAIAAIPDGSGLHLLELPPLSFDDLDLSSIETEKENDLLKPSLSEERNNIKDEVAYEEKPEIKPEPQREEMLEAKPGIREEVESPLNDAIGQLAAPILTDSFTAPVDDVSVVTIDRNDANEINGSSQDWANTEITRPIAGAYLTIYPKLKFIGLCVPGQGYVRKYNQVAMPRDLERPKFSAHDGRTPYGKYFIAARDRGPEGPALTLSWPSPEDGARIGLQPGQLLDVENAWLAQKLPPQNTAAGGDIRLTGDRDLVEETDGGFSLEAPHMEEIFTALPDGAWIFIQP